MLEKKAVLHTYSVYFSTSRYQYKRGIIEDTRGGRADLRICLKDVDVEDVEVTGLERLENRSLRTREVKPSKPKLEVQGRPGLNISIGLISRNRTKSRYGFPEPTGFKW